MIQKIEHRKTVKKITAEKPKIRAAAYCRVSTAQELQEDSFDLQMETYRKRIESDPDLTLVGVYGDLGRSGTQVKGRDEFQHMMQDCRAGKIDQIYVKSISRFGRNIADVLDSLRELKDLHVRVLFEKERLDTADQKTELVLGIMATIAEEESRSIAGNLNWGRKERLKKGKPYGAVTYGYREKQDHTWEIYEPEAERVRTAFQMALGRHNYTEIRMALQAMEDRDGTGKVWIQSTLQYLLVNPYYTGVYISNKTVDVMDRKKGKVRRENDGLKGQFVIDDHHEELISKEDFDAVQELVKNHALFTPKNWRKIHGERSDQKTA
jgi:site-specific DNA recombinase